MLRQCLAGFLVCSASVASAGEASLCGRPAASIGDLLIQMQQPTVEALFRDTRMFVFHDPADSSMWVFSVKNTSAHPAVMCSRQVETAGEKKLETGVDCKANEKVCQSFSDMALAQMQKLQAGAAK